MDERPDPEIARDAVSALKTQLPFSSEHIKVVVKNGVVTLEGQVEWQYQKQTAEKAVRRIKRVKNVTNAIQLKPKVEPAQVKNKIIDALRRSAEVDANRIQIEANGSEVISRAPFVHGSSAKRPSGSLGRRRASPRSKTGSS